MSDIKKQFEAAATASRNLKERPDNDTMLKLYALFKQATVGDVEGKRPGFTDMIGRAKFDAWATAKGRSADDAMREYTALVNSLE